MQLSEETRNRLIAQRRRQRVYEEGVYELSEDEGFTCVDCGWKGLFAPADHEDDFRTYCPECEGDAETHGTTDKYLEPFYPNYE